MPDTTLEASLTVCFPNRPRPADAHLQGPSNRVGMPLQALLGLMGDEVTDAEEGAQMMQTA